MTILQTYKNALLADATYALGAPGQALLIGATGSVLEGYLDTRMTPTLAKYIGDNYTVVTHKETGDVLGSGFDATVWKDNTSGKLTVSMQGTTGLQDLLSDVDLATSGNARNQLADMVNWWLQATTPVGQSARQIVVIGSAFFSASDVQGTGQISAADLANGIEVNGHSLGGYLASAFTRLFGAEAHVVHTSTFNSAGFAPGSEAVFTTLQNLVGPSYGLGRFPNGTEQTNYFAENGINVTTNSFWFSQYGTRVELFNEESTTLPNHYMYKLTDALALGNALATLDTSLTTEKINQLLEAGSNKTAASIEGVFDALRSALQGPKPLATPVDDVSASVASRVMYHATLAELQTFNVFKSLQDKLVIKLASADLRAAARNNFGALVALQDLSSIAISGKDAAADALLATVWQSTRAADYAAWVSDKSAATPSTFTDQWITDRAALLQAVVTRNNQDNDTGLVYDAAAPAGKATVFQYQDAAGQQQTFITQNKGGSGLPEQYVFFGGDGADTLTGSDTNKLGDHLYGGAGADTLDGKGGADYLEGNAGADTLIGGAGNDTLVGGKDFDTYQLDGDFGHDTIIDSDGLGSIVVAGTALSGGKKVADNVWESEDKTIVYTLQNDSLIIGQRTAAAAATVQGTITVQNWQAGGLGLDLQDAPTIAPPVAAINFDLTSQAGLDAYDAAHTVNSTHNLRVQNAAVAHNLGTAAEPVWRSTTVRTGSGDDTIEGGSTPGVSNTLLSAGAGDDRIYATASSSLEAAIARGDNPDTVAAVSIQTVLDGGAGNDQLIGSDGRDVLFGGAGDDTIVGGAGGDMIFADGNAGGMQWSIKFDSASRLCLLRKRHKTLKKLPSHQVIGAEVFQCAV